MGIKEIKTTVHTHITQHVKAFIFRIIILLQTMAAISYNLYFFFFIAQWNHFGMFKCFFAPVVIKYILLDDDGANISQEKLNAWFYIKYKRSEQKCGILKFFDQN